METEVRSYAFCGKLMAPSWVLLLKGGPARGGEMEARNGLTFDRVDRMGRSAGGVLEAVKVGLLASGDRGKRRPLTRAISSGKVEEVMSESHLGPNVETRGDSTPLSSSWTRWNASSDGSSVYLLWSWHNVSARWSEGVRIPALANWPIKFTLTPWDPHPLCAPISLGASASQSLLTLSGGPFVGGGLRVLVRLVVKLRGCLTTLALLREQRTTVRSSRGTVERVVRFWAARKYTRYLLCRLDGLAGLPVLGRLEPLSFGENPSTLVLRRDVEEPLVGRPTIDDRRRTSAERNSLLLKVTIFGRPSDDDLEEIVGGTRAISARRGLLKWRTHPAVGNSGPDLSDSRSIVSVWS